AYAATGQPPFEGQPAHVIEGPANLTGIPPELTALLAACLDKRPHGRPDTKTAMLRLLGEESAIMITGDHALPDVPRHPAPVPPQTAAPSGWGAPPLPQDAAPPAQTPSVLQGPAQLRERPKKGGGLTLVLAACVGVVALLSGLGVWAAGSYGSLGTTERAAANGMAPHASLGLVGQSQDAPPGDGGGNGGGQGIGNDPVDKVTVPWGATADPRVPDVGPLQLTTETPTVPVPSLSSLVAPPPIPASIAPPVPGPTRAPTAAATTDAPSKPTPTVPATPAPTPPAAVKPTPIPTPTVPPAPVPSRPPTLPAPTPTAVPTATARPTVAPTPPSAVTVKPTPTPQPSSPAPPASRPNLYSPQQVCGSGYYVQRSAPFSGGTVYQLYNTSTGSNCVVTMKSTDVGTAT
ncbi:serine/threonine protein kinase, partial [Streptosporangium sp. NPDC087985]